MSWIIKRLITPKTLDYIIEIAKPKLQEQVNEYMKEGFLDLLRDPDFIQDTTLVTDALYERYRRKIIGTMGGLQKGLNSAQDSLVEGTDFFDNDGRLSIKKILPWGLKQLQNRKNGGSTIGNQAQNSNRNTKEGSNAPLM